MGLEPEFLTTREVADLLRIKERKVYELVGEDAVPVSRVTGKLLFPRDLVVAWVRRQVRCAGGAEGLMARPPVVAGSHDPLLDWALRECGSGLATMFDGSLDGLQRLGESGATAAGVHLFEPEGPAWNRRHIAERFPGQPLVLVEWARRAQGLVLPPGNPSRIERLQDLSGRTVMPRQASAGSRILLDHLLREAGVAAGRVRFSEVPARSETDVALAVAGGKADAGLAIEAVARQHRLGFLPLVEERYDLAVWRRDFFEPPLQKLFAFARTDAFRDRAEELGGYAIGGLGTVHYNGP